MSRSVRYTSCSRHQALLPASFMAAVVVTASRWAPAIKSSYPNTKFARHHLQYCALRRQQSRYRPVLECQSVSSQVRSSSPPLSWSMKATTILTRGTTPPNPPAAHSVTWFGCTSRCCAIPTTVLPAAKASAEVAHPTTEKMFSSIRTARTASLPCARQ